MFRRLLSLLVDNKRTGILRLTSKVVKTCIDRRITPLKSVTCVLQCERMNCSINVIWNDDCYIIGSHCYQVVAYVVISIMYCVKILFK